MIPDTNNSWQWLTERNNSNREWLDLKVPCNIITSITYLGWTIKRLMQFLFSLLTGYYQGGQMNQQMGGQMGPGPMGNQMGGGQMGAGPMNQMGGNCAGLNPV